MAVTIKRQPFTVSTNPSNYPKQYSFVQTEFKGLCDDKNDILVNQQTFSDANNVYVDDAGVLVSRSPFKFYDSEAYIVEDWTFGVYKLRLQRLSLDDDYYLFVLRCITHICNKTDDGEQRELYSWKISKSIVTDDLYPKVSCVEIEDKVFIWFAGIDFLVFNTNAEKPFFEDATKYLYLPIHKQIINGFEYDLEAKNFLTDAYIKRYQYSGVSDVDFLELVGKDLSVFATDTMEQKSSEHLYDITVAQTSQELSLLHRHSYVGMNVYMEAIRTPNATVFLRYAIASHSISISFDGKYFEQLPFLAGIIGKPLLTKDGFCVIAFTNKGLAKCKIATDSAYADVLTWKIEKYLRLSSDAYDTIETLDTAPVAYFETEDTYAYVLGDQLYAEVDTAQGPLYWHDSDDKYENISSICMRFVLDGPTTPTRGGPTHLFIGLTYAKKHPDNTYNTTFGTLLVLHEWVNDTERYFFRTHRTIPLILRALETAYDVTNRLFIDDISFGTVFDNGDFKLSLSMSYFTAVPNDDNSYIYCEGSRLDYRLDEFNSIIFNATYRLEYYRSGSVSSPYSDYPKRPAIFSIDKDLVVTPQGINFMTMQDTMGGPRDRQFLWFPDINNRPDKVENGCRICIDGVTGYICSLTDDGKFLSNAPIESDSIVSFVPYAETDIDYLHYDVIKEINRHKFYIRKVDYSTGERVVIPGYIQNNDLVELEAYDDIAEYAAGELPFYNLQIAINTPWQYSSAPNDWFIGDDWPSSFEMPAPYGWKAGDNIPKGLVKITGTCMILDKIAPLSADSDGVFVNMNDALWTSVLNEDTFMYLDEYIGASVSEDTRYVDVKSVVPNKSASLGEHYFAFDDTNNQNTLQVTSTRRDEQNLDFLLYMSKDNEQKFMSKITALHPLSDTQIGVFTDDAIWYVSKVVLDDATIAYTSATKTRLPLGCREGDTVITALDGQAIMFPTKRGLAVMAPQDFIATTEKTLTYLSDGVQKTYFDLYTEPVKRSTGDIKPMVKSIIYKHWVIFYKFMDNTLLLLDTRNTSWWKLSVQYPIKDIDVDLYLCLTVQIEGPDGSLGGVSYLYTDMEDASTMTYEDDVVENTVTGKYEEHYENEFIGTVRTTSLATPNIRWRVSSQKLHLDAPNNYKLIKCINLNLQGTQADKTALITKGYRDEYHPVKENTISVYVDEIRNFVYRLNLMHVSAFEYTLKSDDLAETPHRLCLNALTIKYEVKERIR